jgi:hypothetical protein
VTAWEQQQWDIQLVPRKEESKCEDDDEEPDSTVDEEYNG